MEAVVARSTIGRQQNPVEFRRARLVAVLAASFIAASIFAPPKMLSASVRLEDLILLALALTVWNIRPGPAARKYERVVLAAVLVLGGCGLIARVFVTPASGFTIALDGGGKEGARLVKLLVLSFVAMRVPVMLQNARRRKGVIWATLLVLSAHTLVGLAQFSQIPFVAQATADYYMMLEENDAQLTVNDERLARKWELSSKRHGIQSQRLRSGCRPHLFLIRSTCWPNIRGRALSYRNCRSAFRLTYGSNRLGHCGNADNG